ncbi:response regulator [candidate division KSB1 bacterium]|nr:response regulator [candidate division KSB1 bacterium]
MSQRKILIVDHDPKNLQILHDHFTQASFQVQQAKSDREAIDFIHSQPFDIVLTEMEVTGIDGYALLEKIQRLHNRLHTQVIFLSQKNDVWHRVRGLKLGAKDYIVKPMHVREIVGRVDMIARRAGRRSYEHTLTQHKFVGRLEDLSLTELIESFSLEKKTGLLSMFNINGLSGQIYFHNGIVVNATLKSLRPEDAIYHMMTWKKGRFSMLFCQIDVKDAIGVSNLGLLLQGAKRMEQREELLQQLPSLDAILVTTQNFKRIVESQELEADLAAFVSLFDGERTLGRIIDESKYDEITCLKRIIKLFNLGFLNILSESDASVPFEKKTEKTEPKPRAELDREFEHKSEPDTEPKDNASIEPPSEPKRDEDNDELEDEGWEEFIPETKESSLEMDSEEESDPFSIFRKTGQESEPFGLDDWQPSEFDEQDLEIHPTDWGQEHPADSLLQVPHEEELREESADLDSIEKAKKHARQKFQNAKGTILVLGNQIQLIERFVATLSETVLSETISRQSDNKAYAGTVAIGKRHLLNVVGITPGQEFPQLLEWVAPSALGYIFLISGQSINWTYYSYLFKVLNDRMAVPGLVATSDESLSDKVIRTQMLLQPRHTIKRIDRFEAKELKSALFALFQSHFPKASIR